MKENIDSTVDGLKLVVIDNPKYLSEETMIALYEMAKEKNLNVIEFKNEKGEVKHTIPVSLKADRSVLQTLLLSNKASSVDFLARRSR